MDAQTANALRQRIVALDVAGCPPREIAERAACALSTVYKVLADPRPDRRARRPDHDLGDDDGPPTIPPGVSPQTIAAVRLLHAADPDRSALEVYAILHEHHNPRYPDPLPSPRTIARVLRAIRAESATSDPRVESSAEDPSYTRAPAHETAAPPCEELNPPRNASPEAPAPSDASGRSQFLPFDPSPRPVDPEVASKIQGVVDDLTTSVASRLEKLPDDAASLGVEVSVLRLLLRQTLAELLYSDHGPLGRRRLRIEATNLVSALVQALRAAHTIQPRASTVAAQYIGRLEELIG